MHTLKQANARCVESYVSLTETHVAMVLNETLCLLANGRQGDRALSCLVELRAGDLVLVAQSETACHVLHVLERNGASASASAAISVPSLGGPGAISLRGRDVSVHALDTIELMSAHGVNVTAVAGNLSFNARNLFVTVSETLVQQSRHFIGKAGQYLLDVLHLLRLHGQDALITADRDIKADAERISMG